MKQKMEQSGQNPQHIAIIMDGNRRWARQHGMDPKLGHKEGAKTLENIVRYANKIGIPYLTVYAFSTENWKRAVDEVGALMLLLKNYLDDFSKKADTENIKIKVLGDVSALNEGMRKSIYQAMERTKNNTGTVFSIAFNYGGRDEITKAVKEIAKQVEQKMLLPEEITQDTIEEHLYTAGMPDPALLIRTSNEIRTSNFLPWQLVYSEFYFEYILNKTYLLFVLLHQLHRLLQQVCTFRVL